MKITKEELDLLKESAFAFGNSLDEGQMLKFTWFFYVLLLILFENFKEINEEEKDE